MYRIKNVLLMAAGLMMMCVISVIFGFAETEIPNIVYMILWVLCAGMICRGAGVRVVF